MNHKPAKTNRGAGAWGCQCAPIDSARRDRVRQLCLAILDAHRPGFATYTCLLTDLRHHYRNSNQYELLRALDYLELKGLLTITRVHGCPDQVRLTCEGIDLADEYTDQCGVMS